MNEYYDKIKNKEIELYEVSEKLRDREICILAIKHSRNILKYIPNKLKQDSIILAYLHKIPQCFNLKAFHNDKYNDISFEL